MDKDNKNSSKEVLHFLLYVVYVIIAVVCYTSLGGLFLYMCKLAQSNILPTDLYCFPYTEKEPSITKIDTNLFETDGNSLKISFQASMNKMYGLLNVFRKYKLKPNSFFLANYFIELFEHLFQFDYSFINNLFQTVQETWSETLVILLGPILLLLTTIVLLIVNQFYFIYLWFSTLPSLFKDTSMLHLGTWGLRAMIAIGLCVSIPLGYTILWIFPFLIALYAIGSCALFYGIFGSKRISSLFVIKETLKHYKVTMSYLIGICTIALSFATMGTANGIITLIVTGLMCFHIIPMYAFYKEGLSGMTQVTSYKQAMKASCMPSNRF